MWLRSFHLLEGVIITTSRLTMIVRKVRYLRYLR